MITRDDDVVYGVANVARYLEKDPRQVYRWIKQGVFPIGYQVKIETNLQLPDMFNRLRAWYKKDLDAFIAQPHPEGRPPKKENTL